MATTRMFANPGTGIVYRERKGLDGVGYDFLKADGARGRISALPKGTIMIFDPESDKAFDAWLREVKAQAWARGAVDAKWGGPVENPYEEA